MGLDRLPALTGKHKHRILLLTMAATVSKRQQARNERILQDLIRSVPGNDRCADCSAKNPGWASWNLGIFLCMRCAALHRKLGTHISKVKSLSMDSWSAEQVDNMKTVGNTASNKTFNPHNVRANIPVDIDEVEAAMEKHIRQKYEQHTLSTTTRANALAATQHTGSTGTDSWNDGPAALPPKPGKRFGFTLRSSSSNLPSTKQTRYTPPSSPANSGTDHQYDMSSPPKSGKPNQLFGMRITTVQNNFESKVTYLQEMGFPDKKKNIEVLKSMDGNLEKAVEALSRLGEGVNLASGSQTLGSRALTPVSLNNSAANGISVEKRREPEKKPARNPWEIREEPAPTTTQIVPQSPMEPPRAQSVPPASNSWNPFLRDAHPPLPQKSLDSSFQNLQISSTGPQGYNNQAVQYQNNPSQQSTSPWYMQESSQQLKVSTSQDQQYQQNSGTSQVTTPGNPFLHKPLPQLPSSPTLYSAQPPQQFVAAVQQPNNPFNVPWQPPQSTFQHPFSASPTAIYGQQPDLFSLPQQLQQQRQMQSQSPFSQQPPPSQTQQQYPFTTDQNPYRGTASPQPNGMPQQQPFQQFQGQQPQQPFFQQTHSPQPQQPMFQQPQGQQYSQPQQFNPFPQTFAPHQPIKYDKSSILALYNYGQPAAQHGLPSLPENMAAPPQRSVTMPLQPFATSSNNGFMQQPAIQQRPGMWHTNNESVDFQGFAGNGRNSPDAFSGLSAKFTR